MDFDFTDDQYAFRDSIRAYLNRHHPGPNPATPRQGEASHQALWSGLAELGLFTILAPEAAGGVGLGFLDLALLLEEFGRVMAPPLLVDTLLASAVLSAEGGREQFLPILERVAGGDCKIALAFSEPAVGGGPETLVTTATRQNGGHRVTGRKYLVADALRADYLLVACRSPGREAGLALVSPDRQGVSCRLHECLDVTAAYYEVSIDALVPNENMLFGGEHAASVLERLFDVAALATALLCTGIASRVFDVTLDYVKQRVQFGKPIGSFQALKHRCADLAVALSSSRSAAYYASWSYANQCPDLARAISIAKTYCTDTARLTCNEAIQMHGGMGFTWDLGLHLFLRRTKMLEHGYGDAQYHGERIIETTVKGMENIEHGETSCKSDP